MVTLQIDGLIHLYARGKIPVLFVMKGEKAKEAETEVKNWLQKIKAK